MVTVVSENAVVHPVPVNYVLTPVLIFSMLQGHFSLIIEAYHRDHTGEIVPGECGDFIKFLHFLSCRELGQSL